MAPLMLLKEEDILESLLLEFIDDKLVASPTFAEEAALLDDDSRPQGAWTTAPSLNVQPVWGRWWQTT